MIASGWAPAQGRNLRTLLVDNYDSFSYNLFQLISESSGQPPTVVPNDTDWADLDLDQFDAAVISPGPGRPDCERDFGVSARVISEGGLPVLGVCLGHQGICHMSGAVVDRAPEAVHGRVFDVRHGGTGIFEGIPSPFPAVRYHSLAVTSLPAELEPLAWTEDGVVMAVRHRHRPLWGVQFHPESICSAYGRDLLDNFYHQALAWTARAGRTVRSGGESSPRYKLHTRRLPFAPDTEAAFATLFADRRDSFWLDSSSTIKGLSRFSIMGNAEGPLAETVRYDVAAGEARIRTHDGELGVRQPLFDYLDDQVRLRRLPAASELPFDFNLGYVGYLGYELKAETGGALTHVADTPDAVLVFADRAVVVDHEEATTYLLALSDDGPRSGPAEAAAWMRAVADQLAALPVATGDAGRWPLTGPKMTDPEVSEYVDLRHSRTDYLARIDDCLSEIAAGESYEICLTNTATVRRSLNVMETYRTMRRVSPVPFGALLDFGDVAVLSASPERFLSVDRNGVVEAKPIKGTRPRSQDPVVDQEMREDLLHHPKDRAENLMIVDLLRNDLNRVCEVGSVHVPKLFDVETYAPVHQLVSTIRGRLGERRSSVECVRAAFPGGSMTGAPKVRTMEIIDRLEGGARGVYSGAIGWFGLSGACDLSIVIRTLVAHADRVDFGVGGAIVSLSDPDAEFEETAVKSRAMMTALATSSIPEAVGP